MGILGYIPVFTVYEAIRKKKYIHAETGGYHVFVNVIAHHDAFCGIQLQLIHDVVVILRIRLAMAGIFVGGIQLKIFRLKACPAYPALGGNGGKEGICGKYHPYAVLFKRGYDFLCLGRKAAYSFYPLKIRMIEFIKKGHVFKGGFSISGGEKLPEYSFVCFFSSVFYHGDGTCHDSICKSFR